MRKVVLLLLLVGFCSLWGKDYSLRLAVGKETDSDLGEILTFRHPTQSAYDFYVYSLDGGYMLGENIFNLPLDFYIKGGVALFKTQDMSNTKYAQMTDVSSKDIYEFTFYFKLYYKFVHNMLRVGFGEGGSYITDYLAHEVIEENEQEPEDPTYAKYLNYLDISFDVDLGKLFNSPVLKETYLGYTIKHRSGIFGLINGVDGGSNYNTISIERNF